MKESRSIWIPLSAVLLVGAFSTAIWLSGAPFPDIGWPRLALSLSVAVTATFANLALRWLRWHFILRTIGIRLRARESTLLFTALLPAVLTPWALGELLLAVFLRRRARYPLRAASLTWLTARGTDALALLLLGILAPRGWLLPALIGFGVATLLSTTTDRRSVAWTFGYRFLLTVGLSMIAWSIAGAGMAGVALAMSRGLSLATAIALFAHSTLSGGLSGAPAGIAVTGAALIQGLTQHGIPESVAVWLVAVIRGGTVGFSLALGAATFWLGHRGLRRILKGADGAAQGHFDQLADSYADEIPAHIRDRLVQTKSDLMVRLLARHGVGRGARGLDIGCGQGWYLAHLAQQGFQMAGCDLTAGQIQQARAHCERIGVTADLTPAPAERLPYADATFDFAYTINVIHHITDPAQQIQALREIVRVLKPGAPLIVFEMNTINPLFRLYLSYLFPLLRNIDDGTERWLSPDRLPVVPGARWDPEIAFLTFVPDFMPRPLLRLLEPIEAQLERSRIRRFSAHFAATLLKDRA